MIKYATIENQRGASNGRVVSTSGRSGSFVLFNEINVPATGIDKVSLRCSNPNKRSAIHDVEINGNTAAPVVYRSTGKSTGSGDNFDMVSFRAKLQRGYGNVIKVSPRVSNTGRVELDKMDLDWFAASTSETISAPGQE